MSTELTDLIKAQAAAVTDAYRSAYNVGYVAGHAHAEIDAGMLIAALKELLANVEQFGFEGVSIEAAMGVVLARCALEAWGAT